MNRREVAVVAAFVGLLTGMVVAFASCSYSPAEQAIPNHCKVVGTQ